METEVCKATKVFEKDRFAGTPKATPVCAKAKGHDGAHEGIVRTTAYVWRDKPDD